jgi:hypothetical protein
MKCEHIDAAKKKISKIKQALRHKASVKFEQQAIKARYGKQADIELCNTQDIAFSLAIEYYKAQ